MSPEIEAEVRAIYGPKFNQAIIDDAISQVKDLIKQMPHPYTFERDSVAMVGVCMYFRAMNYMLEHGI